VLLLRVLEQNCHQLESKQKKNEQYCILVKATTLKSQLTILAIHIKSININTGNLNVKQRRDDIE